MVTTAATYGFPTASRVGLKFHALSYNPPT